MTIKYNNEKVALIIFLNYVLLTFLKFYVILSGYVCNVLLVLLGGMSFLYCVFVKGLNKQLPFVLFLIIYTVAGGISFVYSGNAQIQELLWPMGFMSFGVLFLNFPYIFYHSIMMSYYGFVCLSIYQIYNNGGADGCVIDGSRNNYSVYVVLWLSLYMISAFINKKSICVLAPLLGLMLCVMAVGRSGIVVGICMVLCFLFLELKKGRLYVLKYMACGVILIFIMLFANNDYVSMSFMDDFKKRQFDSLRYDIWRDYINICCSSLMDVFCGARISGSRMMDLYSQNLHNSFFMLHAKYGVIGVLEILFLLINTTLFYARNKCGYLLVALFAVVFRMSFDYTNFNGPLDTVLIILLLWPFFCDGTEGNSKNECR